MYQKIFFATTRIDRLFSDLTLSKSSKAVDCLNSIMFTNSKTFDSSLDSIIDNCLVWKDNIGHLPGSLLKFRRDSTGELWLADEKDETSSSSTGTGSSDGDDNDNDDDNNETDNNNVESLQKRQKLLKDHLFNDNHHHHHSVISLCSRCFRSDFKADLVKNNKYCKQCSQIDPQLYKIYKNFDSNSKTSTTTTTTLSKANINEQYDEEKHANSLRKLQQQQPNLSNDFEFPDQFDWEKYLKKYQSIAVPVEYFSPEQNYPTRQNGFKVGMKLEGIDPLHPSKFCCLTVVDVQGFRLRLHFDGYSSRFDFWINADSKQIFPIGFCRKTRRKLEYPPGMNSGSFNWKQYLSATNSIAAHEDLFTINKFNSTIDNHSIIDNNKFQINDKLEAVDIANSALICVATIKDILDDQILIHFDGWDDSFDYWTSTTSPLIHPINWCKSKSKCLTAPNGYRKEFIWEDYLRETDSRPAPETAFNNSIESKQTMKHHLWRQGMRLEAVDKRNPYLIRVATVVDRNMHSITIHFDGWDEKYDCLYNEDSPDLHPINWCKQTNHKLEPPPNKSKLNTLCPVAFCNGFGHQKWYRYRTHSREKDCPYSKFNYDSERNENLDRFADLIVFDSEDDDDDDMMIMNEQNNFEMFNQMDDHKIKCEPNDDNKIHPYYLKLIKENYLEMKETLKNNNVHTLRYLMNYVKNLDFNPFDIVGFDCQKMFEVILKLTNNRETANIFIQEKIDGIAFLCIRHEEIQNKLKIDLNSAVKIVPFLFANLKFIFKDGF
uniref:Lethal(3)malignant brain tumor-like protein 4 isoform X2 n=1 Tax=Dermatophagoides pteronyssinus TaxID=6956 RepID=A0A6P6Y3Z1_DERPT|nr:lethal(3)malignant brain tumor-like protein 4 isoform X2 [Dermatophagoides pteronyssinus]